MITRLQQWLDDHPTARVVSLVSLTLWFALWGLVLVFALKVLQGDA